MQLVSAIVLFLWIVYFVAVYSEEFTVFPIVRHDLMGLRIGSKASAVDCELQPVELQLVSRRCLLINLIDASSNTLQNAEFHNVGGVIIILPSKKWSNETIESFNHLEQHILSFEFSFPLYITFENARLTSIYNELARQVKSNTAVSVSAFFNSILSTGFRLTIPSAIPKPLENIQITNFEGHKTSSSGEKLPTIVVCAHYDVLSAIPSFSYGADASASGTVSVLEIARLLNQVVNDPTRLPRYDVVFLLFGGGNYNYLGAKRWLDHAVHDSSGLALLDSISQVICLEGMASIHFGRNLYAHLSRPPKSGSFSERFLRLMNQSIRLHTLHQNLLSAEGTHDYVQWVHKKININQGHLSWEHERFSIHRLPSMTLTSWPTLQTAKQLRHSSLDAGPLLHIKDHGQVQNDQPSYGNADVTILARNIRVVSEALSRLLFDLDDSDEFSESPLIDSQWVTEASVSSLMDLLLRHPRSTPLLGVPVAFHADALSKYSQLNKFLGKRPWPGVLGSLEYLLRDLVHPLQIVQHSLTNDSIRVHTGHRKDNLASTEQEKASVTPANSNHGSQPPFVVSSAALNDIEVVLYGDVQPKTMMVYGLKSSVFELLMAAAIVCYLGLLNLFLEHPQGLRKVLRIMNSVHSKTL